jgi:hypothetical protein
LPVERNKILSKVWQSHPVQQAFGGAKRSGGPFSIPWLLFAPFGENFAALGAW